MVLAYIGVGSNLGNRLKNILSAKNLLENTDNIEFLKISSIIETEPVGGPRQGRFLNAVFEINTELSPEELLETLNDLEAKLGRKRTVKWGPRSIDLDILFYGDMIIDTVDLKIPHPLLHERRFVLEPLNELNPELEHPIYKEKIKDILKKV